MDVEIRIMMDFDEVNSGVLDEFLGKYGKRKLAQLPSSSGCQWAFSYGDIIVNSTISGNSIVVRDTRDFGGADRRCYVMDILRFRDFWEKTIPLCDLSTLPERPHTVMYRAESLEAKVLVQHETLYRMVPVLKRARVEAFIPLTFEDHFLSDEDCLAFHGEWMET